MKRLNRAQSISWAALNSFLQFREEGAPRYKYSPVQFQPTRYSVAQKALL